MRKIILKIIFGAMTAGACIVGTGCCDGQKPPPQNHNPFEGMNNQIPVATRPTTMPTTYEHKEHTEDVKTSEPKIVIQ